jgi:hypothetical protein
VPNSDSIISAFSQAAAILLPHRFTLIRALDDGTAIPAEALSDDHSIGIYWDVAPRKMREHVDDYEQIDISCLRPKSTLGMGASGSRHEWFLEYVPMRGVRFRAEQLQYLEEGWTATLAEVKYPAQTVLALTHLVREASGSVITYLNTRIPMPLWIRAQPFGSPNVGVQIAVQARAGDQMRPTNIHTECPMEYARQWVAAARTYFDPAPDGP